MSGIVLGIDLGTTNSVVALADGKKTQVLADKTGRRLIPSVVSFHPDGRTLVGEGARDRRLIDARNTVYSVKRLIGRPFTSPEVKRAQSRLAFKLVESPNGGVQVSVRDEEYTLTEISAYVLREVRKVAEEVIGQPCRRAVITVPANFNELQRSATKAAGRVAGLDVLRIINEPTAAALAYGLGKQDSQRVAVYDLGGGTFDITILEMDGQVFEVVSTGGDSFLGGDDCDLMIAEAMADACLQQHRWDPRVDAQAFERLRAAGEWIKCALSEREDVNITIEELTFGPGGEPLNFEYSLTREQLFPILQPLIARTFDVVNEALVGASMKPSEVDNVILVGGSTRMPLVRSMVEEFFQRAPEVSIDPDLVVAQGAAIHGYSLAGEKTRKSLGRIRLKKATASEVKAARLQREKETEGRPKQPAFAPPRPPPPPPPPPRAKGPTSPSPNAPPPTPGSANIGADRTSSPWMDLAEPGILAQPAAVAPEASEPPLAPPLAANLSDAVNDLSMELDDLSGLDEISAILEMPSETPPQPSQAEEPSEPAIPPIARSASDLVPLELDLENASPTIGAFGTSVEEGVLPMPDVEAPLLMDVTSHSFGIETAGGYCQHLVRRNAPIPAEQTRIFTTAHDNQERVVARVCQGESRTFEENEVLGEVELSELRASARGELQIEVRFVLNASGTLDVTAMDVETGRAQTIQINLRGGLTEEEIDEMAARQQAQTG